MKYITIPQDEYQQHHDAIYESRRIIQNDGYAAGCIKTRSTYIVADGIKCLSPFGELNSLWKRFVVDKTRSISGEYNFMQMIEHLCRERDTTGVGIILVSYSDVGGVQFQSVKGELLSNPNHMPNTPQLVNGVEYSKSGKATAYHFHDEHTMRWTRVPKFTQSGRIQVLVSKLETPLLTPCIEVLYDLKKYRKATCQSAILSSTMAFFLENPEGDSFDLPEAPADDLKVRDSVVTNLPPGAKMVFSQSQNPTQSYDNFIKTSLQEVASATEISLDILTKNFEKGSYSSSTAGSQDFFRSILRERKNIINDLMQPIFELFVKVMWMTDQISLPGFMENEDDYYATQWLAQGRSSINPRSDIAALEKLIALGLKSRESIMTEYNNDQTFEELTDQINKERKLMNIEKEETV